MSNVDINVDRRTDGLTDGRTDGLTDGQKIGRLYRTLLQAGAIKIKIRIFQYIVWGSFHSVYNGFRVIHLQYKNSAEGVIAPAGAKVTEATIRTWLLNKFISFLAVLT